MRFRGELEADATNHDLPLPIDAFLDIFVYLSLQEILSVRMVCKSFLAATRSRSTWLRLIRTYQREHSSHLPVVANNFDQKKLGSLPARALEIRLLRAIKLHRNWTSATPQPTKHVALATPKTAQARIMSLEFLPGRDGRWILSVTALDGLATVQCWDVDASPPACIASMQRYLLLYGPVVNLDPTAEAIFTLQSTTGMDMYTINFIGHEFIKLGEITVPDVQQLLFQGSAAILYNTIGYLCLVDVNTGTSAPVPTVRLHRLPVEKPQAMILRSKYVVIAFVTTVQIFPLPGKASAGEHTTMLAAAKHVWQWPTEHVSMVEQGYLHPHPKTGTTPEPIDLFIRFGSVLPWPVNMLHHFVLLPNPLYIPSIAVSATNLPYLTPPKLMQSLSSPVRLFSLSDVTLGPYGTALFLDSDQDESQNDVGQRLAGQMLTRVPASSSVHTDSDSPAANTNTELLEEPVSGFPSMVFGVRGQDTWTHVAMDEQAGRIAVGCVDGGVELFEYV